MEQLIVFFRENGYVFELLSCNLLFMFSQEKRSHYPLRVLLSALALVCSALLLNQLHMETVFYNFLKYAIWFFITVGANILSCKVTFSIALFSGIGAYVCQHMAFKVGEVALYFLPNAMDQYASSVVYLLVIICMYIFSFFAFARRIKKLDVRYMAQNQLIILCIAVAIYTTILQFLFTDYIYQIATNLYLIYASFDIICCMFAMTLQYGIFKTNTLEGENKLMEHVLHMQQEKYKESKENIELINIKCHDLKKQLSALSGLDAEELQKMHKTLNVYDMSIKSGNEVLDIVLAEKSLTCEKQHIHLECMADGGCLHLMSASDIYSLSGNAIDNAIESVIKVTDRERRFINISIKQSRGLLIFHIENPYEEELQFLDGLPVTTKADKNFHGFGLKSIQRVVEKYNGFLSITTENNLFNLNVAFLNHDDPFGMR